MNIKYFIINTLFLFSIFGSASGETLTASVSTIDISPPIGMKFALGGYGERMNKPATGIHDNIRAKALMLKMGNRKYAVITLDLLMLPGNVKSDLVKRITVPGWSNENIILLPSHSHGSLEMDALNSQNDLNNPQLGVYQPELLAFLLDKLEKLFKETDRNYQPVKIGTGSQILEGLNQNRRKDPDIDKELIVTRIDLLNGTPLAVLVNWTAHPTFLDSPDMLLSAEWPGYLQTTLADLIGNRVTVMYFNGSEGDQAPILEGSESGYEKIKIYGNKIADKAFGLYKEIKCKDSLPFNYSYMTISLPHHEAHPTFMKTGGDEYGITENTLKRVMDMLGPEKVGLGALRIGDLLISGVPGELTAILGQKVKTTLKNSEIKYVAIGGIANQWISYVLSLDQYLYGEGYESSMSFYGPDLGEVISNGMIKTANLLIKNQ